MDFDNGENIEENNIRQLNMEEIQISKEQEIIKSYNKNMKILLNLYNLNDFLKKQLDESIKLNNDSSFQKEEFYLIRQDYFSYFLKINSYEQICQALGNKQGYNNDNIAEIFLNLIQIHEYNFFETKNILENFNFNDENLFMIEYRLNNEGTEILFNNQYILLNKAIFLNIIEENNSINYLPLSTIINNKKLIIKLQSKNSILIGEINNDDKINIFSPEIILEFNNTVQMENQFNFFENNNYGTFEETLNTQEKMSELKDKENNIIGILYVIDKNKYNNLTKFNENIIESIYRNYEDINMRIKYPFEKEIKNEKCYLINNSYMEKLKELIRYDEIVENNINKDELIFFNSYLDIIRNELSNEELLPLKKSELKIDEDNIFYYFKEFSIISKEIKDHLIEYDLIQKNQELIEFGFIIGDYKIIMYSFIQNKNILMILSKANNKEYITELIIVLNDSIELENFVKTIKEKGFDNFKKELLMIDNKCDILNDKKEIIGKAYDIMLINQKNELKIKEQILNMIKIYMFNKEFINNIILSKKKDIQNKNEINIFSDKCYLINRDYIEKYKEYYSYYDIEKFLDNLNNKVGKENIDEIYKNIPKNLKELMNKEKLIINEISLIPKSRIIDNEILHFDDFIIVNEDIYNQLLLSNNKNVIEDYIDVQYIINSGKIFLCINSEQKNQVFIGERNDVNNNLYFNPKALLIFNNINEFNIFTNNIMKLDFSNYSENFLIKKEEKNKFLIKQSKKEIAIFFDLNNNNPNDDIFKEFK